MLLVLSTLALAKNPPVPLELVGHERTPKGEGVCELVIQDHAAEGVSWSYRVTLSSPDPQGISWVQRVTMGPRTMGLPASSPSREVRELDVQQHFVDARVEDADGRTHMTYVRPRSVDWKAWPLELPFIGPRADAPSQVGDYTLRGHPEHDTTAWASCHLSLSGPGGVGGCSILTERRGTCITAYLARHAPPK